MTPSGGHPHRTPLRRAAGPVLALLLTASLAGCKTWHLETMPPTRLIEEQQPPVVRVDRASDTSQVILHAPSIVGDSLRGLPTELAIRAVMVPLADISRIATRKFSLTKTVLVSLAVGGGVALYQLIQSLNQTSF